LLWNLQRLLLQDVVACWSPCLNEYWPGGGKQPAQSSLSFKTKEEIFWSKWLLLITSFPLKVAFSTEFPIRIPLLRFNGHTQNERKRCQPDCR
jgi:hypothetical protein